MVEVYPFWKSKPLRAISPTVFHRLYRVDVHRLLEVEVSIYYDVIVEYDSTKQFRRMIIQRRSDLPFVKEIIAAYA